MLELVASVPAQFKALVAEVVVLDRPLRSDLAKIRETTTPSNVCRRNSVKIQAISLVQII